MSDRSFTHLHVHTEYSMLDGAAQLPALFAEVSRLGMSAIGMTDHGNMYGAFSFYEQAKKTGIKPILGIEAYLAPESRFHKKPVQWGSPENRSDDISGGGAYTHMTLLAENATGLRNLFALSSRASMEGYYYKPRMDRELISRHSEGIIATTGCPSGEVQTRLRLGQKQQALQAASDFRDIFGPENFFLELMDHGLSIEQRVRDGLLEIAKALSLQPIATNDSHYVTQDQSVAHEALLCVQSGKTLDDPKRFKFDGDGYYIKPAAEMQALWDSEVPDACDNTLLIAERVQSYEEVFTFHDRMPRFPVPEGETQQSWLGKETWKGLDNRFPGGIPDEHRARAEYELTIIEQMGFPAYFLVVADLCRHAREQGIRVGPGRGSATGCIVAWALRITELDPIEHKLLFERFLNPDRISMPDIDLDFDERRRGDMIRYVTEKWGEENVAQIITFGTIKAKAALKDAARIIHGQPGFSIADKITKSMPPAVMGKDISLTGIVDPAHPRYAEASEIRNLVENDPTSNKIFTTARGLEGLIRQAGVHAAGVILSSEPLIDVLPIWRRDQDGAIITGWDYPSCESVGLLKMDFLGLRNLTVLDDAVKNIVANRGETIDLDTLPLADDATFALMARGDTLGVFQLDGGPMRSLLRAMAPTKFGDIAAVLALYRPGPMAANAHNDYADRKNNRKPVVPIHPELAEPLADILDETYGLIVYQEQVMAIAQKVAGYSLGKADLLRRAMGKKKKEILDKEFVGFEAGMKANGYSDAAIKTLWDILLPFAGYAFNKSHTAGYGIVSFWTAYLKANYAAEYMAALLTSVADSKDKMAIYLAECRRMGIQVLPPDVNESALNFTPVGNAIRFGLGAVRNVGAPVVNSIARSRDKEGRFTSFQDFLAKAELVACNKRVIESLIKSGAFDSLDHTRKGLLDCHETAVDSVVGLKRDQANGQFDLFGAMSEATDEQSPQLMGVDIRVGEDEWPRKIKLGLEREMLGLYVSSHPLAGAERLLRQHGSHSIAAIVGEEYADDTQVTLCGMISSLTKRVTKQGSVWAIAAVEDLDASVEVLFFPKTYELLGEQLFEDSVVVVKGRVKTRDSSSVSVIGMDVMILDVQDSDLVDHPPVVLVLPTEKVTIDLVDDLKNILSTYPGDNPVHIKLRSPQRDIPLTVEPYQVNPNVSFLGDIKQLLGASCIEGPILIG